MAECEVAPGLGLNHGPDLGEVINVCTSVAQRDARQCVMQRDAQESWTFQIATS